MQLPPYSPELNPTEHIWEEVREKWFPNIAFNSLKAVEDTLVNAFNKLENDKNKIRSLTGFNWIATPILNAK